MVRNPLLWVDEPHARRVAGVRQGGQYLPRVYGMIGKLVSVELRNREHVSRRIHARMRTHAQADGVSTVCVKSNPPLNHPPPLSETPSSGHPTLFQPTNKDELVKASHQIARKQAPQSWQGFITALIPSLVQVLVNAKCRANSRFE